MSPKQGMLFLLWLAKEVIVYALRTQCFGMSGMVTCYQDETFLSSPS